MKANQVVFLIVFLFYMVALVAIGFHFHKKKMNTKNYLLAGRSLNPWVSSMSAQASDMSGWLLMGLPGLAAISFLGAREAVCVAIGLLCGTMLNWVLTARRLRVYTELTDSITLPEFMSKRFNDEKGILRILAGIVILIFFTAYTASMFSAGAVLISYVFNMNYTVALIIGAVVIVAYTFLGGFLAVSWTDLFQGILMFMTLVILPLALLKNIAGNGDFAEYAANACALFDTSTGFGPIQIISSFGWGLGYFGMPHILVRFMAIKDKNAVFPATTIASIWTVITLAGAIIVAMMAIFAFGFTTTDGTLTNEFVSGLDSENIIVYVCQNIFKNPNIFTYIISGVLLTAILAAIMSTADSQLLVASSAFANDIYKTKIKKNANDSQVLKASKICMIVIAVVAFIIALNKNSSIFKLVSYAWAGFGASFGPLVLFSLYSKKITFKGAASSIIVGCLTTILFKAWLGPTFGSAGKGIAFFDIYELVPGFVLATIALFLVSALDGKKDPKVIETFDKMIEEISKEEKPAENQTEESSEEKVEEIVENVDNKELSNN